MSDKTEGYFYLALAMILVGSTVIASKVIAAGLPPFTATALRFAIALPGFLLLMKLTGTRLPAIGRGDRLLLVLQAVAGSVGYTTLLISGLRMTSAADAGVIIGTLPVVSALVSIVVLKERPGVALLLAIGLATAGVVAVAVPGEGADGGRGTWLGNALVMGAVVCESLFILLNKRLRQPLQPLALSTVMTAIGLAASIVPALLFEAPWRHGLPSGALTAVLYYALVPTVAGFVLWYAGSARTSGTEASLFTALAPISAVAMAFLLLGEPVGFSQLVGIGCVVVAVLSLVLAGRRNSGAPRAAGRRQRRCDRNCNRSGGRKCGLAQRP
ncbi:multidrug DMT transporter permease [Cupriavidus gilardii CR3]|uniref:DMT family transporter n=1 Tax=Cupriavidus gilardii TaxID=82541 RepID=A0A849BBD1_9BURK|nr:DMT family transporter [Cupriavidus gilardii]ALD93445.1 multidrug DMT transporter permease [Cupriavidus gilardii CR3]KAB0599173.1 DMT family transporter [Cupriavidus gilardii]MCT9013393.1 DMT family transporter [Cupriavidus gilardii]MCT9052947.1 DMT family transporter [Cupriavidus gilardii]NNH13120.1 DMT family transporter [Cupriavidus gilardii]